jgi:tRNA dimethylallyltransferase
MDKVLVICGPTATGKTALAAQLAKKFDGELVSADSRQVYRGMDVTTGKDRPEGVKIWLYDVVNPDEEFSVSHWVERAREAVADIQKRKKLPIVVGGTGLYIRALLHPLETIDVPPDKKLRERLKTKSVSELQAMLERGDMNDSDWNNPRRLQRRIEIGSKRLQGDSLKLWDALQIGLTAPIAELDNRIDARMDARKKAGLEKEIMCLQNYSSELPAMSAIGVNEHAYAKRQLTWFKKQKDIRWFDVSKAGYKKEIESVVRAWYTGK